MFALRHITSVVVFAFAMATLGSAIHSANADILYQQDFTNNPGWTTDVPDQMYWDSSNSRYHLESRNSAAYPEKQQYVYFKLPVPVYAGFSFAFDITYVRADYAGGINFALASSLLNPDLESSPDALWVNYAQGSGGTGSTVGYSTHNTASGSFPGPYECMLPLDTTYHQVITYDKNAHSLSWQITSPGLPDRYYSCSGVGDFTAFDRILSQIHVNGGTGVAYLDNVVVSSVVPLPTTASMLLSSLAVLASSRLLRRSLHPSSSTPRL